jgi:4-amino-4-deoxy-L-arabinose transferase-like glycosyltransferase
LNPVSALSNKKKLFYILLAGLALRIYISFVYAESWYTSDSWEYINQAKMLLDGKYATMFPNGYPIIISVFIFLTGSIPAAGVILILLNIVLSVVIVYLVYRISLAIYKEESLALIAALLVSLYPNQINYVRYILSDVSCTFFLVLALYLLANSKYKLSALSVGVASIMRTTFLPLGILLSIFFFIRKEYNNGKRYLLFTLIPVCILLIYGFLVSGKITLGVNVFYNFTLTANNFEGNYIDADSSINDYVSYLVTDPVEFIKDRFLSLWDLWGPLASTSKWENASLHYRIIAGLRFPLLILAFIGFLKIPVSPEKFFMAAAILILTCVHFFYFSNSRYSLTVEPFLAILAAKGIMEIYFRLFRKSDAASA